MLQRAPHTMLKLIYPAITGLAIFAAQVMDEKATVPLYTAGSIICSLLVFTITTTRKLQKFIDRLEAVEQGDKEVKTDIESIKRDMALKTDIDSVRREVIEMTAQVAQLRAATADLRTETSELKGKVDDFRSDREADMEHLRVQMRTDSMMQPVSEETGMRILMIDDNDQDIQILRRRMSPTFILESAETLREGTSKLKRLHYDAVFLDLKLPDARYNRTVEDFVADNPGMLVIVLTGSNDEATTKRCFDQGADGVWIKGIDDVDIRVISRRLKEAIWRRRTNSK